MIRPQVGLKEKCRELQQGALVWAPNESKIGDSQSEGLEWKMCMGKKMTLINTETCTAVTSVR